MIYFSFKTIKISDPRYNTEKTWQVVGIDPYYGDGIIQVFLDEYFENPGKAKAHSLLHTTYQSRKK